ncbi:MAG: uracil-DNA glycosylase family protein [candidate division WOR-3 bacterium]
MKALNELIKKIRSCQCCADLPKESYPVLAGRLGNKIMVIGQAPGKQELKYNKPFVGPAGRRLFQWLNVVDIKEEEFRKLAYFTQMMKCYPGAGNRGDLKPKPKQISNCASYLEEEFRILRPRIVIPVGKLAIEKLLGKVKLETVVGKKFIRTVFSIKTIIIPLPHPSGASPWSFKKENQKRIVKAVKILKSFYASLKRKKGQ